ncbi:patatin [Nostoc calcicola FACHB-389]|nr:patatin-like phospholipase family protein [Nostoc calcicola FACHB-3891]OKH41659.1 patatin [Nostoc calcicola FACHB-389]
MKVIKILSIDGGGIRGVIPAVILSAIEDLTGKHITDLFDFIAGTSTGGILTLGITKPDSDGKPHYTANDLIKLYEQEGQNIFHRSEWIPENVKPLVKRMFPSDGIEGVLGEYFKETKLSEALKEVLITSYDVEKRSPYFFKRSQARKTPNDDFPMAKVARATSAAPTYFEPLKLEVDKPLSPYHALIDGGVFANNPAMCAYAEVKSVYPNDTDVLVVSIGTGELARRLPYEEIKNWGMAQWAQPILDVVFDGISDTVDYQLKQLLSTTEDGNKRYYRFQTDKLPPNNLIHDTTPNNIQSLKILAENIIQERESDLKALCENLVSE